MLLGDSGTGAHKCCFCPLAPLPSGPAFFTQNPSQDSEVWRGLTTTDVGKCNREPGLSGSPSAGHWWCAAWGVSRHFAVWGLFCVIRSCSVPTQRTAGMDLTGGGGCPSLPPPCCDEASQYASQKNPVTD